VHVGVVAILQEVVEASTAGSPTDVLRWTSKSKTNLSFGPVGSDPIVRMASGSPDQAVPTCSRPPTRGLPVEQKGGTHSA
jgi:hypothetical protein